MWKLHISFQGPIQPLILFPAKGQSVILQDLLPPLCGCPKALCAVQKEFVLLKANEYSFKSLC